HRGSADAGAQATEAVEAYEALGDPRGLAVARGIRGLVAWSAGRPDDALADLEAALAGDRATGDRTHEAAVLSWLACVTASVRRFDEAIRYSLDVIERCHQLGQPYSVAMA